MWRASLPISTAFAIWISPVYPATLVFDEQHLYGSQRLGVVKKSVVLTRCMPSIAHINNAPMWHYYLAEHKPSPMSILRVEYQETFTGSMGADVFTYTVTSQNSLTTASVDPERTALERGHTRFELSNHLGNPSVTGQALLAVISDRKLSIDNNTDGSTDYYEAYVANAQDYYLEPMAKFRFIRTFGMQMPGRSYTNAAFVDSEYSFGFNGQEKDDELYGEGNSYDFGARLYDVRVGRCFRPDRCELIDTSYTTYGLARNSPLYIGDDDGNKVSVKTVSYNRSGKRIKWNIQGIRTFKIVRKVTFSHVQVYNATANVMTDQEKQRQLAIVKRSHEEIWSTGSYAGATRHNELRQITLFRRTIQWTTEKGDDGELIRVRKTYRLNTDGEYDLLKRKELKVIKVTTNVNSIE